MILDALKGTPTTKPDHFKTKARAQTPMHRVKSDSSLDSHTGSETYRQPGLEIDPGDIRSCGKSDGNIETALIAESFRKSTTLDTVPASTAVTDAPTTSEVFESSEATSQDVTLSEIRDRTLEERSKGEPRSKKSKRTKRRALR